jgi:hypothetical protein
MFMDIEIECLCERTYRRVLYARNTNLRSPSRPAFANALVAAHPGYQRKLIDTLVTLVYKIRKRLVCDLCVRDSRIRFGFFEQPRCGSHAK